MPSQPTIVLIAGSWHTSEIWNKVVEGLSSESFKCIALALPSSSSNPQTGFGDDVEAVRTVLVKEIENGNDVIIVAHSFGGQVGNSACKGLTRKTQIQKGVGHVIGIVLIASGFTMTGVSFLGGMGGQPLPQWKHDTETGLAEIVVDPREMFYHDLPSEEGGYWVSKLTKQSFKALADGGEYTYAGWMDVPSWYLSTTEDKGLPIQAQRWLTQFAKDSDADVTVQEVESGHSPMLSKPQETVDFILAAAKDFDQKR